jgi:Glycosyltransferase family 25 (LPS biosynthesis protein)
MLTSLGLLQYYSSESTSPSSTDLHGLKLHDELNDNLLHQQNKFGSLAKPAPGDNTELAPDLTDKLPPENTATSKIEANPLLLEAIPDEPVLANATLDFGKIYVLNLETREDRHDEMALIAAASGLEFTYVAGVNSKALEKQSLPDTYGTPQVILEPAHLACYRGHANIWRKIVEDGVETALIIEDDVDFDLNIREIAPRVKEALGRITKEPNQFSNSPGLSFDGYIDFSMGYLIPWNVLRTVFCQRRL